MDDIWVKFTESLRPKLALNVDRNVSVLEVRSSQQQIVMIVLISPQMR